MYSVVFCITPIDFYERYEYCQTDILQIIHRLKRKTVKINLIAKQLLLTQLKYIEI